MQAIANVVLPVFGIMLAGYLAGRFGLLGEASSDALNRFVYFVALPALFFVSMAEVEVSQVFNWPFLGAYLGGMLGTFLLAVGVAAFLFPNRIGALGLHGLCATFANTGYMGIPLLMIAFGESGTLPAIITTVVNGAVVMALGIVLLEFDFSRGSGPLVMLQRVAGGVLRSPLVVSAVLGLALAALELPVPAPLATFCRIIGAATGPCALFAIGLFMVGKSFRAGVGEVSWLVGLKLLVQPLLTGLLAYGVFTMDPLWAAALLVQSALPTGALVFVLARQYNVYIQRTTAAIMISTLVSVATLSLLFSYMGIG